MGTRSAFVSHEPVRVMHEDGEQWIAIKPKLGMGDRNALLDVLVSVGAVKGASDTEITARAGAFQTELLRLSIVDWHLLDDGGQAIPFDRDKIGELDPDDPLVEKVADEVVQRNPFGKQRPTGSATSGESTK